MKKTLLVLAAILTLSLFAGCGAAQTASSSGSAGGSSADEVDLTTLKTLADAFSLEGVDEDKQQRAFYDDKYVYVFTVGDQYYRVVAEMPADISEKLFALEFDDDYDEKEKELSSGLVIKTAEKLNDQILPQEELDALVGKTGKELFDAGWLSGSFYNTETLEVFLDYGPFSYDMHFDGKIEEEEAETFDVYEDLADMKVLDVRYEGLGDATNVE